jgi:beta-glucosidase
VHVLNGDNSDVAGVHYRRYGEDAALVRSLEISSDGFTIAWTRVVPRDARR